MRKNNRFLILYVILLLCTVFSVFSFVVMLIKYNKLETRISRLEGNSSISTIFLGDKNDNSINVKELLHVSMNYIKSAFKDATLVKTTGGGMVGALFTWAAMSLFDKIGT